MDCSPDRDGLGWARSAAAGTAEDHILNDVDLRFCSVVDLDKPFGPTSRDAISFAGAATLVLVRTGSASTRHAIEGLRQLRALLGETLPVVGVGRVDVAMAAGLAGILLGRSDMAPNDARRLLGPHALLGMEVQEPAHADELYRWPVDFALIGRTAFHAGEKRADPEDVARMSFRIRLAAPGTAIAVMAGLDPDLARRLIVAGADGIACSAPEPGRFDEGSADRLRASVYDTVALRRRSKGPS
jgi:thiamine-phosphate pyrophosphorylase